MHCHVSLKRRMRLARQISEKALSAVKAMGDCWRDMLMQCEERSRDVDRRLARNARTALVKRSMLLI
jgi:hypothetical protein